MHVTPPRSLLLRELDNLQDHHRRSRSTGVLDARARQKWTTHLKGHKSHVNALALNASESLLASGGDDHQVLIWDTRDMKHNQCRRSNVSRSRAIQVLAWNSGIAQQLWIGESGVLSLLDVNTSRLTMETRDRVASDGFGTQIGGIINSIHSHPTTANATLITTHATLAVVDPRLPRADQWIGGVLRPFCARWIPGSDHLFLITQFSGPKSPELFDLRFLRFQNGPGDGIADEKRRSVLVYRAFDGSSVKQRGTSERDGLAQDITCTKDGSGFIVLGTRPVFYAIGDAIPLGPFGLGLSTFLSSSSLSSSPRSADASASDLQTKDTGKEHGERKGDGYKIGYTNLATMKHATRINDIYYAGSDDSAIYSWTIPTRERYSILQDTRDARWRASEPDTYSGGNPHSMSPRERDGDGDRRTNELGEPRTVIGGHVSIPYVLAGEETTCSLYAGGVMKRITKHSLFPDPPRFVPDDDDDDRDCERNAGSWESTSRRLKEGIPEWIYPRFRFTKSELRRVRDAPPYIPSGNRNGTLQYFGLSRSDREAALVGEALREQEEDELTLAVFDEFVMDELEPGRTRGVELDYDYDYRDDEIEDEHEEDEGAVFEGEAGFENGDYDGSHEDLPFRRDFI